VRVESYFLDSESAILGKQIVYGLSLAGIDPDDAIMNVTSTTGSFLFAVHVYGGDEKLTTALLTALDKADLLTSSDPPKGGSTGFAMAHREINQRQSCSWEQSRSHNRSLLKNQSE
jgi:hypothetical protein